MAAPRFIHLRTHSAYSLSEGALPIKQMASLAVKNHMPALAITDTGNLFGALEYSEALAEKGVQPIIGALLSLARPGQRLANGAPQIDWLALYAQDATGYGNLCALVSHAHLGRPVEMDPHVTLADMAGRTDGLICLTAGGEGALTRLLAGEQAVAANVHRDEG